MAATVKNIVFLLAIAAISYTVQLKLGHEFLFSLVRGNREFFWNALGTLSLACALVVLLKRAPLADRLRQPVICLLFIAILLGLSPWPGRAAMMVSALIAFFFLEKRLPKKGIAPWVVYSISFILMYAPVVLYSERTPLSSPEFFFLLLVKTCITMRLISWVAHRRVYKRADLSSLWDYLEFLLCPVFFIFPSQIQLVRFQYFHQCKRELGSDRESLRAFGMGAWGILTMIAYGFADQFFWNNTWWFFTRLNFGTPLLSHFVIGAYWLVAIYFEQVSGMAFQVCLARFLGYQIKYDMHWPLLARSPLDYLRRHSSYARDYVVEMGVKPIALPLMRWTMNPALVYPIAAIAAYAFIMIEHSGYRPDYERPWLVTALLILFPALFIVWPLLRSRIFGKDVALETIASPIAEKPLNLWKTRDVLAWLGTMIILSATKELLGMALHFARGR